MCASTPTDMRSLNSDLLLHVLAPWVFLAAGLCNIPHDACNHCVIRFKYKQRLISGVTNFSLRSKCSDSHDAYNEKGCPLPNAFNHNALFHTLYTIAIILLIVAELLAIQRRKQQNDATMSKQNQLLDNNENEEKYRNSINKETIV